MQTAIDVIYNSGSDSMFEAEAVRSLPERFIVDFIDGFASGFGKANGTSICDSIVVKYRDEKTDTSTKLEDYLR